MEPSASSPERLDEIVPSDSLDFDSWTLLISEIEKTYSDNIKIVSLVYESFLSRFPLCHGYWKRYADHKARLCTVEKAVEIFERAVQSATYSVGLWVDYCSFGIRAFADPSDIRRIFERGLYFVGKDFLCHTLWDMYVRFELSKQQWNSLAHILIRSLKFPTKSLHKYYDNFREFVAFLEEDMSFSKGRNPEPDSVAFQDATTKDEIYHVIMELQDSSNVELRSKALYKLITVGERFYCKSCQLHEKIDYFENYMERECFDVKKLDDEELENWHNYLDFIEKQDDFDWAVKLYERCLIPCANYPEFWMRYVEFMESKGGRELAILTLKRATEVFLKNVQEVHIFNARFREQIGDIRGARAAFLLCDTESDSSFIETAIQQANMEKRLGNLDTASYIYDKAINVASKQKKLHIIPILYVHFFRLKYLITGSVDAAIDLLIDGIQHMPHSKLLLEELINFAMMHEGSRHLSVVDPIIATAITWGPDASQGLSFKDREDLSRLYLKFVDQCGTTLDVRKAWNRHIRSFPHLIRNTSPLEHPTNPLSNELAQGIETIANLAAKQPPKVQISADEHHKSLPSKEKDDDTSVKEKNSLQILQSEDDAGGEFKESKSPSKDDASGSISTQVKAALLPNESPVSRSSDQIGNELEAEHEKETDTHRKPVSLEGLSLNTQEKESKNLTHSSPIALEDTESAKKPNESESSSSPGHRNLQRQTDPQQEVPAENTETCQKTQQQPPSPLVQGSTVHSGSSMQVPNQNQAWPVANVQPQMVQYPMQSGEHTQAYNQMWQYQYQQQQLLQMQQSYLLQQQQQPPPPYVQQQQQYVQQQPQQQLYQHQEQYQQYLQGYQYQVMLQQYQQQQGQGYHQLQEYMGVQQYQQQQVAVMPNQIWNGSYDQQSQAHTSTSSHARAGFEMPYTTTARQQSPLGAPTSQALPPPTPKS